MWFDQNVLLIHFPFFIYILPCINQPNFADFNASINAHLIFVNTLQQMSIIET